MAFLKSPHAKVWPLAVATASVVALGALAAGDEAPPSAAAPGATATLAQWQAQFAPGLQVSLRAVADGNDRPAAGQPGSAR